MADLKKIFKTERITKVSLEDTLSRTSSLLSSSHDSAFVFGNGEFLGVINPYYCLIKKSYPANTKVKNCLVHPPKLDVGVTLERAARLMIESKIHYLPVFSQNKFVGIISARRILSVLVDEPKMKVKIGEIINNKKPLVSIFEDDFLSKAIVYFKDHKISKLVVVGRDLRLRGILAYFDLISYLVKPRQKQQLGARAGDKTPFLKRRVKNFMKRNVLTLARKDSLSSAVSLILDKGIGSVVVVDGKNRPQGIITTKDILFLFSQPRRPFKEIQVAGKRLSQQSQRLISQFISQTNRTLSAIKNVSQAKIFVSEKQGGGVFKAIFSLFQKGKQAKVIKKEGKDLRKVLTTVAEKMKRAIRL